MQTLPRSELLPMLANLDNTRFGETVKRVLAYQIAENPLLARLASANYGLILSNQADLPDFMKSWPQGSNNNRIPFLPISLFKTHVVKSGSWEAQTFFVSSGTTGQSPSHHAVRDLDFYLENARRGFAEFYGDPSEWAVLALLPSYLERSGSSLVAMARHFIKNSKHVESGFFLHDLDALKEALLRCRAKRCKTLLLGVSFALLDFAEKYPMDLSWATVMETGGMKGRRKELTRTELHQILYQAFRLGKIHSEYGMTELFSQAYSSGGGLFFPTKTMRALATEIYDPFCLAKPGRVGVLNIIDLANVDTCSFIQTEDIGRVFDDGSFEVLGRLDAAEMRGCNLMVL